MYTNRLFESYNKQLNEKINKDNIEINRAIANPNAGKNVDKIKAAGYETKEDSDGKVYLIKNPKTNKSVNPSMYNRDKKGKVDFKGKLDSDRPYKGEVPVNSYYGGKGKEIPNRAIIGKYKNGTRIANAEEFDAYSSHNSYIDDKPNYTSISKNVRDYKDAVKTRDDSTKSAERSKDNIDYYVNKVKQAQDDLDRENQWIKDKEKQASDAEARRKAIIDNIRKRKTESEELKEVYSERYGGDPEDFITDVECIKIGLMAIHKSEMATHLAQEMIDQFIETCDSQISMTKGKIEAGEFKESEELAEDHSESSITSLGYGVDEHLTDAYNLLLAYLQDKNNTEKRNEIRSFTDKLEELINSINEELLNESIKVESEDLDEGIISDLKQKHLANKIGKTHAKMMSNENPSKINKKQYDKNWKKIHSLGKKEKDKELSKAKKNNEKSYELSKKADKHVKKANSASTKVDNLIKQATDKYLDKTNKSEE